MGHRRLTSLFALVILTACGGSTGPSDSIFGTYTMRTMGGSALPHVTFASGADSSAFTDGTFTLNEGGTYREVINLRSVHSGVVTIQPLESIGTFVRSGTVITTTDPAKGSQTGTISNGMVTFGAPEFPIVFVK